MGLPVFPTINGWAILADNKAGNRPGGFVLAPSARHIFSNDITKEISAPSGRHHPPVFKNMSLLNGAGNFVDLGFYKYVSPTGFPFQPPNHI
jgi:hypothetical protein